MRRFRSGTAAALVAGVLVVGAPRGLTGQERGAARDALPPELADLRVGDAVRAVVPHGARVEGRVAEPWPSATLRLVPRGASTEDAVELPVSLVDSLSVAVGRGGDGAFLGGVIGTGLGLLALYGVGNLTCEAVDNDCDPAPAGAWVAFAAGGAALGAGIGWIIGRDHPRWEPVYP